MKQLVPKRLGYGRSSNLSIMSEQALIVINMLYSFKINSNRVCVWCQTSDNPPKTFHSLFTFTSHGLQESQITQHLEGLDSAQRMLLTFFKQ